MEDLQGDVNIVFRNNFGRTPLKQRLDDIMGEALELHRYTDLTNLKEEAGDLLATTIMLCEECGWDYDDLVLNTLDKIKKRSKQYLSLGRKTKVAILGGAFNPPTKAHIEVAKFVLDTSKTFDEVWLMPAYQHMYNKDMVSAEGRLEMCRLAVECDQRIKVCDYEIANKLKGETYQTTKLLLEEDYMKNENDFSWIIGLDNAISFDKWVNYELLERMARFIVVPRRGVKVKATDKWFLKEPHIFLEDEGALPEMSSTDVRVLIKTSGATLPGLKNYLDDKVHDYILKEELYL